MKTIQQAVDEVRRREGRIADLLKRTGHLWLKNPEDLTQRQRTTANGLSHRDLKTGQTYFIEPVLQEFFDQADGQAREVFPRQWYFIRALQIICSLPWTTPGRIRRRWQGIPNQLDSHLFLGTRFFERIGLIQAAKAKICSYRTMRNLISMRCPVAGKLSVKLPR